MRVAKLAIDYRYTFHSDVVVDLIGYRRYGHSEIDDPTITQPLRYARIKDHPPLYKIYAERIGVDPSARATEIQARMMEEQSAAARMKKTPVLASLPAYWAPYNGGSYTPTESRETGVSSDRIRKISELLTSYPGDFHLHPKMKKLLEQRVEMGQGKRPWIMRWPKLVPWAHSF